MAVAGLLVLVPYGAESPPGEPVTNEDIILAALGFYGMQHVKVYTFQSAEFASAFSDAFDLYAVMDLRRHPVEMHAMAWHRTLQQAYDVTGQFNELLALQGVIIGNVSQAVKYAKAYAAVANPELQGDWEVLDASDAAALNRSIVNPSARSLLDGWNVTLSTLQRQNGVLSNWTIVFTGNAVSRAEWEVVELLVGDYELDWEAVNLRVGTIVKNRYPVTGYVLQAYRAVGGSLQPLLLPWEAEAELPPVVSMGVNFDGSEWNVRAESGPSELSVALTSEAVKTYAWQVGRNSIASCGGINNPGFNWGYLSRDVDCQLEINVAPSFSLLCGACVATGNQTRLWVHEDIATYLFDEIQYLPGSIYDVTTLANMSVSHLHLVHLEAETPERLPDVHHAQQGKYYFFDDTLDVEHFAIEAIVHPALEKFASELRTLPGYVMSVPKLDGTRTIVTVFIGSPPVPPPDLLPPDWSVVFEGNALVNQPAGPGSPPDPEVGSPPQYGYPGYLLMKQILPEGIYAHCTAGFILQDATGTKYVSTAGHCGLSTNGLAFCQNCSLTSSGKLMDYSVGQPVWLDETYTYGSSLEGDFMMLDTTGVGVLPTVLGWGGPSRLGNPCTLPRWAPIGWYGNGAGLGELFLSRARLAFVAEPCPNNLYFNSPIMYGPISYGDSGSPIVRVDFGSLPFGKEAYMLVAGYVTQNLTAGFVGTNIGDMINIAEVEFPGLRLVCPGGCEGNSEVAE